MELTNQKRGICRPHMLVLLFVFAIICLLSIGFLYFYILMDVRLLELLFPFCYVLSVSRLGFGRVCINMCSACAHILEVCVCIQLGYAHRSYVCAHILMPRSPNPILSTFVSLCFLCNMLLPCSVSYL